MAVSPRYHGGLVSLVCCIASVASTAVAVDSSDVDYTRYIRPLLSQHCFACHGPDESSRQAELRLDRPDTALGVTNRGARAIVPGQPDASDLLVRIASDDDELRMPPADTGHRLSAAQVDLFRRWIEAGARFDDHWSFRPLTRPALPDPRDATSTDHPIDLIVRARCEREGVSCSPEAERTTLIRRLSFDLLGLPPEPAAVTEYLADDSPNAYERLVDRLLASPHFGERWGRHWLDLAHYADSDGYLGDGFRNYAWLYRDWVMAAINNDLPFDQFTIEQLAGDLLPDATLAQRTATGFLRNTMRNTEAGVDLEEYRLKEIVDRVNTVGVGWLGLSLGCAECHSHKYDPISQREFYQLFAFFNDADDVDVPASHPEEQSRYEAQLRAWQAVRAELAAALESRFPEGPKLCDALALDARQRTADQTKWIESLKQAADEDGRKLCDQFEAHQRKKPVLATKVMTVSRRATPRTSYVHLRGDYRRRGEDVVPNTPAVLPPLQPRSTEPDRLDLARWLVDTRHPLTPRVVANQIWKHLLGRGLVATVDDFGASGEAPSHPELLDWLACQFVELGWSRKALIRSIVTSGTYRQASGADEERMARDPLNILLARQVRLRLEAETIRDAALAAAGLLERKLGGPGIRPPQPDYVARISRNTEWQTSTGGDLYRRGMYIVFRRATPYPMLLTFDAPDSSIACTRRERTNSPLQALTLLNDPVFVECAQALGRQLAEGAARSFESRLKEGFQRCLGREPQPPELARLRSLFDEQRAALAAKRSAAEALAKVSDDVDPVEAAAWVLVARVLLNLDEFITRE